MAPQADWRREAWAFQTLVLCLHRTAVRDPPDGTFIPLDRRPHAIDTIEASLDRIRALPDPPVSRASTEQLALHFFVITEDMERAAECVALAKSNGDDTRRDTGFAAAEEFVRSGRLQEALTALADASPTPWVAAHKQILLLAHQGEFTAALDTALKASEAWPDVVALRVEASKQLLRVNRHVEALAHARSAFALMPGRGQRLLLAQTQIAAGLRDEAWTVLAPLAEAHSLVAHRLRAYLSEEFAPAAAVDLWKAYLRAAPADAPARMRLAQVLFVHARAAEASAEAWQAFTDEGASLGIADISLCAILLDKSGLAQDVIETRLVALASYLRRSHARVPAAEQAYLRIWGRLRDPSALPPPDFPFLEAAGVVRGIPTSDMPALLAGAARAVEAADAAYVTGAISFETLCRLTSTSTARTLARYRRLERSLSIPLSIFPAAATARGTEILLGDLELFLLAKLGLVGAFQALVSREFRLVIFEDVRDRIFEMAASEADSRAADDVSHLELLRDDVDSSTERRSGPMPEPDKAPASRHEAGVIVNSAIEDADGAIPVLALLRWLRNEGFVRDLELKEEPRRREDWDAYFKGGRIVLSLPAVHELRTLGVWGSFVEAFDGRYALAPQARAALNRHLEIAREALETARVVSLVHEFVGGGMAAGWLKVEPRPVLDDLPPARDLNLEETRRCINEAGSWREALVGHSDRILLSADFLASELFIGSSPVEWLTPLRWDQQSYLRRVERARSVREHEMSFGQLVRSLEPTVPYERLLELLELGLADAISAEDIATVAGDYRGFARARPRKLLDLLERPARTTRSMRALVCRTCLARLYAEIVWNAFTKQNHRGTLDGAVSELLTRAEGLAEDVFGGTLFSVFNFLVGMAASRPRSSLAETSPGSYSLSSESPAGHLWADVVAWCASDRSRMRALQRGLLQNLVFLDKLTDAAGPSGVAVAPILLAANAQREVSGDGGGSLLFDEAMAILSSGWEHRPLEGVVHEVRSRETPHNFISISSEAILTRGAELFTRIPMGVQEAAAAWLVPYQTEGVNIGSRVPPEALLLRVPVDDVPRLARSVARSQGAVDGRLVELLRLLESAPSDVALRRKYAAMSAAAPWRLVAHDPIELLRWGQLAQEAVMFPSNLDELRAILSEPRALSTDRSIVEDLDSRCAEGGVWAGRPDLAGLLDQCTLTPGQTPLLRLFQRRSFAISAAEADDALRRIAEHPHHAIGQITADIVLLRGAAEQDLHVQHEGRTVSTREVWADTVGTLLTEVQSEPSPGTIAALEGDLLNACAWVVERLALRQPLAGRDGIWLTYRLFQWIGVLLDIEQLRELVEASKELRRGTPELPEVLDPIRFGWGRFDHRLASILFAVYHAPLVGRVLGDSTEEKRAPGILWSERLGAAMASIATRTLHEEEVRLRAIDKPESALAWDIPLVVPTDLARLLLMLCDAQRLGTLPDSILLDVLRLVSQPSPERIGSSQRSSLTDIAMQLALHRSDVVSPEDRRGLVTAVHLLEENGRARFTVFLLLTVLYRMGEEALLKELQERVMAGDPGERVDYIRTLFSATRDDRLPEQARVWVDQFHMDPALVAQALADACDSESVLYVTSAESVLLGMGAETSAALERVRARLSQLEVPVSNRDQAESGGPPSQQNSEGTKS